MLLVQRTVCCNATRQVYIESVCDRLGSVARVPAEWDFSAPAPRGGVQTLCVFGGDGWRVKMSL